MEDVQILRFAVEGADSISDLKDNIRELKKQIEGYTEVVDGNKVKIEGLKIGTDEYKQALKELEENQAALRNAMHGTATSMEQVTAAAKGQDQSYNGLVRTMAIYKEQLRAIDTSTEQGVKDFQDTAAKIREVNDQLKALDALQGNFQRNVGNYEGALSPVVDRLTSIGGILKDFPPTLGAAKEQIGKVGQTMQLVGKNPLLGTIGLLAPIIMKIADSLRENETALAAVDKAMNALQPVFDFFSGILEKIAGLLSQAVDYILELGENSGIEFKKIVSGAVGVGNALLQFILIPIRNTIDGAKALGNVFQQVFKGQFKQAAQTAKTAVKDIADNVRQGFDFKGNFEAGKKIGEEFAAGLKSSKKAAENAGKEVAEAAKKTLADWDDFEKELKRRESNYKLWTDEITKDIETEFQSITEDVTALLEEYEEAQWAAIEVEREAEAERQRIQKERLASFMGYTSTLSDLSGAIADIYEADADADEAAAKKAKGFKIASAILSTLNGAVAAFTSTWSAAELTPTVKAVLAPMNAAAVLAAGYAQVKQMNSVKIGNDSSSAAVPAPAFSPQVAQVRNVTGQREEERLYQNQRVFLVYSDLEIANTAQRVKVRETEF